MMNFLDGSHLDVLQINKIKYKRIRETHLVYLLFIVESATCFDPAGSSSGLHVNQVMLKNCAHLWDLKDVCILTWICLTRGYYI
jgi:hypothetical protein